MLREGQQERAGVTSTFCKALLAPMSRGLLLHWLWTLQVAETVEVPLFRVFFFVDYRTPYCVSGR